MRIGEQVSISITARENTHYPKTLLCDVEEFLPYEPSAYVWTPGWNCGVEIEGETVWFFVDEAGVVYNDAGDSIGLCPAQEREYEMRLSADEAMEKCECGDPGDCVGVH